MAEKQTKFIFVTGGVVSGLGKVEPDGCEGLNIKCQLVII